MDINLVVLCGKLAAPPEVRQFESGARLVRSLITVRSDAPRRRVDVVPVTFWDPEPGHELLNAPVGETIYVAASMQRRFWTDQDRRRSSLEVVAHHMEIHRDRRDDPPQNSNDAESKEAAVE